MKFWIALWIAAVSLLVGSFLGRFFADELAKQELISEHKEIRRTLMDLKDSIDSLNDKFYQSEIKLK